MKLSHHAMNIFGRDTAVFHSAFSNSAFSSARSAAAFECLRLSGLVAAFGVHRVGAFIGGLLGALFKDVLRYFKGAGRDDLQRLVHRGTAHTAPQNAGIVDSTPF